MSNQKKAIIYLRVSTLYQSEENGSFSLLTQENKCRAICTLKDLTVLSVYRDEGISGRTIEKRKGLQEALNALEEGMYFVVYSLSRASRDLVQAIQIANHIKEKKAHFISCSEDINTSTAIGTFFFQLMSCLSHFESSQISERVRMGLNTRKEKLLKEGKTFLKSRYGYAFNKNTGDLDPIPEEQEIIKRIIKMRNTPTEDGESNYTCYSHIAKTLNEEGLFPKKKANGKQTKWAPQSIKNIIKFEKKLKEVNKSLSS